ncbi:MAG: hypothetical protein ACXWPM_04585 [Bdellovibrionota bacterium]
MFKHTLVLCALGVLAVSTRAFAETDNVPQKMRCTAQSNGIAFEREDESEAMARQQAIVACEQDSRTNNSECQTNVFCGAIPGPHHPQPTPQPSPLPPYPIPTSAPSPLPPVVTPTPIPSPSLSPAPVPTSVVSVECTTTSGGKSFSAEGDDRSSVSNEAIAKCKADPMSKADECDGSLSCN